MNLAVHGLEGNILRFGLPKNDNANYLWIQYFMLT